MPDKFENPLAGAPYTVEAIDQKGDPKFKISPRVLTPQRAKLADDVSAVLGAILVICFIMGIIEQPSPGPEFIICAAAIFFSIYYILAWIIKETFHRRTKIVMTTESISVRRWFGWKHFDRNLEHRFALLVHDLARDEQLRHDYELRQASAKGRVIQKKAYYGESFHIVLLHAGHRKDLLSVYGYQESTAIIARLQYCDRCLNEAAKMGGGISQRPEDDWNQTPGGLDHA